MTIKDQLAAGLKALGATAPAKVRTTKYEVLVGPAERVENSAIATFVAEKTFFLGTAGALRFSCSGNVSYSYPVPAGTKRAVIRAGERTS